MGACGHWRDSGNCCRQPFKKVTNILVAQPAHPLPLQQLTVISIKPSRSIHPEHPQNDPSREHV